MLFNIIEKSKVSINYLFQRKYHSSNVYSVYLVKWFNFSTIRIFLQNRIWLISFRVMSSFVQVAISQNGLKLLGSVEK